MVGMRITEWSRYLVVGHRRYEFMKSKIPNRHFLVAGFRYLCRYVVSKLQICEFEIRINGPARGACIK